jgi:two-component system response regulator HydG
MSPSVLVVDDDRANLDSVARILQHEGWNALSASDGAAAVEMLRRPEVAVLLTDLMMPGMDGQELLATARALRPEVEVVLMTAYGTVEAAVSAMKDGAYDFLTKPLKRQLLVKTVEKALERPRAAGREPGAQGTSSPTSGAQRSLVGQSPAFRSFLDTLKQAAPSTATVLLLGESGTGKELAARALHELSGRGGGPFVAVNCGAFPETLLEAELFGVEKGAFTGATARKPGRFERANGGTLFLDEVGEMPGRRAGEAASRAAGGRDRAARRDPDGEGGRAARGRHLQGPGREVAEGRFREDLYYRLNVVEIRLPPLSWRREDIPLLADHFLRRFSAKNGKSVRGFSPEALAALEDYAWPGNVRELEHAVERAVVLARGDVLDVGDLPDTVRKGPRGAAGHVVIPIGTPLEEVERRVLHETLRHTGGDKSMAARLLGIATRTIYRKLERDVTRRDEDEPGEP